MDETLYTLLFREPHLITSCLLVGSLEGLSGGSWKAPEEVLCQRPASRLPHPNIPGHCSKRSQFWDPSAEDPQGLGPGDRRGLVPCRGTQGPHAGEDQAAHLLWRSDVSRGRSGRDGDHRCPRALRNCTETQQQTEEQRGEVASGDVMVEFGGSWDFGKVELVLYFGNASFPHCEGCFITT